MGASQYSSKAMLDWVAGGATPTRPTSRYAGISLGTPTSTSGSECSASAYARQPITFVAASTPSGSATLSNSNAFTFTFSSACTVQGFMIWDTNLNSNSGNLLWFGTLSASSVMVAGDTLAFAAGNLVITLA